MKHQRIAIIGAGTAGLSAATLLGRQGHEVTLIERAPLSSLNQPHLQQRYAGSSIMLGALPTGSIPGNAETKMLSLFWSLPVAKIPHWQSGEFDLKGWKSEVSSLWPELAPLVDDIQSSSELLPATYRDVIMSRWGEGRIGVIGDAAHAMSPQLGQGANMALLDARAIAKAVEASDNWESAWDRFYAQRRGSIRFYQRMSRLLTPLFQSNIPGAAFVRDIALPVSHRLPWLRRQMAETVAGRKERWILRS
jgi:2-polyprenyl-6-methoxyphenol hydroxylase-like FAD-dependent oxidoreductase